MTIFEYQSYKKYVNERVKAMPRGGHGQLTRMASFVGISPVIVTQVLKGDRDFSEEQALSVAGFLGLHSLETEYFLKLLSLERAGTRELKNFHRDGLEGIKRRALDVKQRVGTHKELDEAAKSVFYSDWTYSAARLLTSIPQYKTPEAIAEKLELSHARVAEIVEFLLQSGLCTVNDKNRLGLGVARTHLEAGSRFSNTHRRNWRLKGLEGLNSATPDELFYSAPCTISAEDFAKIKAELLEVIASLGRRVPQTKPEDLVCLNIDWFKVK